MNPSHVVGIGSTLGSSVFPFLQSVFNSNLYQLPVVNKPLSNSYEVSFVGSHL